MRKYLIAVLLITSMFVRLPLLADNQAPNQIGDSAGMSRLSYLPLHEQSVLIKS